MNLGKRILSVKGNSYMSALRAGRPYDAIDLISKDYTSIIDNIIDRADMAKLDNEKELSKIVKFCMYTMANYGMDTEYYDYDIKDTFFEDYRNNLKMNGYYLPEEVDVYEFLFEGADIEPRDYGGSIMDAEYGELKIPDSNHTIMAEMDLCADVSIRLKNADDLSVFLEVCYDTFIDLYKDLNHQEELDAIKYAPYTILTDYINTILFNVSYELAHDILKMYTNIYPEFKQFQVYEGDYIYSYPKSITECIVKDDIGMGFLYNYREYDEENVALVCICMIFKNYLERRIIV